MRLLPMIWRVLLVLLLTTLTAAARAEPYELYARYIPVEGGDKHLDIRLSSRVVLPRATADYTLEGVYLHIKDDDVSKTTLANLSNLVFILECNTLRCKSERTAPMEVKSLDIKGGPYTDIRIVAPEQLVSPYSVEELTLRVRSTFSSAVLCAEERKLREADGKEVKDWHSTLPPLLGITALRAEAAKKEAAKKEAAKKEAAKKDEDPASNDQASLLDLAKVTHQQLNALGQLGQKALLLRDGEPILYSFCGDVAGQVQWSEVAKRSAKEGESQASIKSRAVQLRAEHTDALGERLARYMERSLGITRIEMIADASDRPKNLVVSAEHPFSVVKELGLQLSVIEVEGDRRRSIAGIVDQKSRIELLVHNRFCESSALPCATLIEKHVTAALDGPDEQGNPVRRQIGLRRDGHRWTLVADLREFLGRSVTLTLSYKQDGHELALRRIPFDVENTGMIMSFPVVSEIITLYEVSGSSQVDPKDLEFNSSIPISWAFNASANDGRHMAITLPFMLGYNTRSIPRLANIVRVFPHMSLILPLTNQAASGKVSDENEKGDAQLALGAGVSLLKAFSFSWGISVNSGANYVLVGISPPDLAKIGQW